MKLLADQKCQDFTFSVGDQVLLKLQPYTQSTVASKPYPKLAFKYFGPYTVLERVGSVAYCNTPGVCHQLSNGFELNHDMFSGDGDVKVKPMEMSPNLNSDIAPLLYI